MSWSETVLLVVLMLSVPVGMIVYYLGEEHGMHVRMVDQYNFLKGRTWLWVDGKFYQVDATDDQMKQVREWQESRRRVMCEMEVEES